MADIFWYVSHFSYIYLTIKVKQIQIKNYIMEQIKPNKKAQESAKQQCYEDALKELKRCADKGIDRPTVRFWAPSFIIGHNVHEMLEKHGVTCVERGMGSDRRSDGSYDFRITYEFN